MRRALIIALVGLILILLLDWSVDYQMGQYQHGWNTKNYYETLFGGTVFLGLRDGVLWYWISSNHDALLVVFTAALFCVTFFLVRYTKNLWVSTSKLVFGAEDTAQRQLRAYLSISPAGLEKFNPNEMFHFRFISLNSGQTPAYSVRYNGILEIIEHPIPENYPFPAFPRKLPYLAMIPPHTPIGGHLLAVNKFNKADIIEILAGKGEGEGKRLYIFGQIDYIDAFGKNHWTRFCYSFPGWYEAIALAKMDKWEEIAKNLRQPGFALNMEFAPQHNITDDG